MIEPGVVVPAALVLKLAKAYKKHAEFPTQDEQRLIDEWLLVELLERRAYRKLQKHRKERSK